MERSEILLHVQVEDAWYPDMGIGTIINTSPTRVYVKFPNPNDSFNIKKDGSIVYDYPHAIQFLKTNGYTLQQKNGSTWATMAAYKNVSKNKCLESISFHKRHGNKTRWRIVNPDSCKTKYTYHSSK